MAAVMARQGLGQTTRASPGVGEPQVPVQLELPVLLEGFRPLDRKPRRRRMRTTHRDAEVNPALRQLDLNLVIADLLREDDLADEASRALDAIEGEVRATHWEQSEVVRLHLFLLDRSIEVLADTRTSASTIFEVLNWMHQPAHTPPAGFSYQLCCRLAGYDADALLEQIEYEVECLHGLRAA